MLNHAESGRMVLNARPNFALCLSAFVQPIVRPDASEQRIIQGGTERL
jgi:hypothetical protein